ncbi:hypothetical protein EJ05DRAFT_475464 [Pseudovirgaria hyperparasitica]|uniref:TPR-like protein n=1 Tax=Pseudovirgaria hyperparasitica TaxID=470096 RepID=A0A6A6WAN6_9PEZI|nr:uncharacterized protein EJ05DRAFT_475464 [Pseudovirgaria hyperparasitica]KAF2759239.1 hypothetical protein EJ05DRAFT_475464 [Pseudovirgaria hyperparasitica]
MAPPAHISRIDEIVYTYAKNYPQAIKVLRKELKKSPSVFCQIWIAELHSRLGQYVQAEEILLSLLEAKPTTIETNYLRRVYNAYALNKRRQGIIFLGAPSLVLDHFKAAEAIFLKSKVKVPSSRPMEIFFQCAYGSLALKDLVAVCSSNHLYHNS